MMLLSVRNVEENYVKRMDSMEVLQAAAIIQSVDIHERLENSKASNEALDEALEYAGHRVETMETQG